MRDRRDLVSLRALYCTCKTVFGRVMVLIPCAPLTSVFASLPNFTPETNGLGTRTSYVPSFSYIIRFVQTVWVIQRALTVALLRGIVIFISSAHRYERTLGVGSLWALGNPNA